MDTRTAQWLGLTRSVYEWEKSLNAFDRVAMVPRAGDVLRFTGGLLSYEVLRVEELAVMGSDFDIVKSIGTLWHRRGVIARRALLARATSAEPYAENASEHNIDLMVWADLVRACCKVEEGPDGSQPQGG